MLMVASRQIISNFAVHVVTWHTLFQSFKHYKCNILQYFVTLIVLSHKIREDVFYHQFWTASPTTLRGLRHKRVGV